VDAGESAEGVCHAYVAITDTAPADEGGGCRYFVDLLTGAVQRDVSTRKHVPPEAPPPPSTPVNPPPFGGADGLPGVS
jgi:hypothetical protein